MRLRWKEPPSLKVGVTPPDPGGGNFSHPHFFRRHLVWAALSLAVPILLSSVFKLLLFLGWPIIVNWSAHQNHLSKTIRKIADGLILGVFFICSNDNIDDEKNGENCGHVDGDNGKNYENDGENVKNARATKLQFCRLLIVQKQNFSISTSSYPLSTSSPPFIRKTTDITGKQLMFSFTQNFVKTRCLISKNFPKLDLCRGFLPPMSVSKPGWYISRERLTMEQTWLVSEEKKKQVMMGRRGGQLPMCCVGNELVWWQITGN